MVGPKGGSQGWPAKAVQMRRSRSRSEVSVGIMLVSIDKVHGAHQRLSSWRSTVAAA